MQVPISLPMGEGWGGAYKKTDRYEGKSIFEETNSRM